MPLGAPMRTLVAIAALGAALAAATVPATAAPAPPLGHEGRWLTDDRGRAVILHGVNMVHKVDGYRPQDTGFGRDDARFLARHGFNTVRLGIIYKGLEPRPPRRNGKPAYRRGYLRSIARTQRILAREGIFTLLDFHQDMYNERFEGEGWPDWQTLDDGLAAEPRTGFPANYLTMEALQRAYDHFWANDSAAGVPLQKAYARAWRKVARHFRGRPYVAGYDLLNEPWPGSAFPSCLNPDGCEAFDRDSLTPFSKRVIAAIRKVDRRGLAFYEPNVIFDYGARTWHGATGDPNAGFSFHPYCLEGGGGVASADCAETERIVFGNADEHVNRTGDVPLVTEFGATDDLDAIRRVIDLADRHMVGWQYWHYCDCNDPTTTGPGVQALVVDPSRPPRGANVKRAKLRLLARPFPRTVAGTPTGYSFDPGSRVFELRYATEAPGGGGVLPRSLRTEVMVPRIGFPGGYIARAAGAKVTSKRNASVVRLKRERGSSDVSLRIEPRGG